MMTRDTIIDAIQKITGSTVIDLERPEVEGHGDYSSNIAMLLFAKAKRREGKKVKKGNTKYKILNTKYDFPRELAEILAKELKKDKKLSEIVDKIEVAGPGFINFWLAKSVLVTELETVTKEGGSIRFNRHRKGSNCTCGIFSTKHR